eukprot:1139176-Pelagomonas_calceolata.AAC.3
MDCTISLPHALPMLCACLAWDTGAPALPHAPFLPVGSPVCRRCSTAPALLGPVHLWLHSPPLEAGFHFVTVHWGGLVPQQQACASFPWRPSQINAAPRGIHNSHCS